MNAQFAELVGRVYSRKSSGSPGGWISKNRGFNIVNFGVSQGDGCGAGQTCHANTCSEKEEEEPELTQDAEQEEHVMTEEDKIAMAAELEEVRQTEAAELTEEDKIAMAAELEEVRQTEAAEFAEIEKATGA